MITVVDYDAGNVRSVVNAFEAIGQRPVVTNYPAYEAKASAIVLLGVDVLGKGIKPLDLSKDASIRRT